MALKNIIISAQNNSHQIEIYKREQKSYRYAWNRDKLETHMVRTEREK